MGRVMLARIENDLEPLRRDLRDGMLRTLGLDGAGRPRGLTPPGGEQAATAAFFGALTY